MRKNLLRNEPLIGGLVIACLYLAIAYFVRPARMIELLNGAYIGVVVTVVLVYWRTGVAAILGVGRYGRVQRFALGCALQWLAFTMLRGLSAFMLSFDNMGWIRESHLVAIPVLMAVVAGVMQVTAPGMGPDPEDLDQSPSQFVHGRDGPMLLLAVTLGLIVACIVIAFESAA